MDVGPYRVLGELGRGGAGVVFRALDGRTGREVALKLLHPAGPERLRRFRREAELLTRLSYPAIVRVLEVGEHRERPFLAMELVAGESLQARLDRGGPLPPEQAVAVALALASGLEHAHGAGVVHRDLKPDNVLLGPGGEVRLTDFGLALDLDPDRSRLTATGVFLGTPGYWSPEQAAGEPERIGPAADVYGLGATLYAALTGRPPLEHDSLANALLVTADQRPLPPSERVAGVPRSLDAVCLRCLEKKPEDRYPSVTACVADLVRWRGSSTPARRGRRLEALLGGLAFLGLAAAGALLLRTSPADEARRALALLERGELAAAEEAAGRALARDPDLAAALTVRAAAAIVRGNGGEETLGLATRAVELEPGLAVAWAVKAQAGFSVVTSEESRLDAERALELDPRCARALLARGLARALEDRPGAADDLVAALESAPGDPLVAIQATRLRAALALRDPTSGAKERARAEIQAAIDRAPDLAGEAHEAMLSLLSRHTDTAASVQHSRRLAELEPHRAGRWSALAGTLTWAGDRAGALVALERGIALGGAAQPQLLRQRAWLHYLLDRIDEALEDAEAASRIDGDRDPFGWGLVGRCRLARGEWAAAEEVTSRAIAFPNAGSEPYLVRAHARRALGNLAGALEDAQDALRREGHGPDVIDVLAAWVLAESPDDPEAAFERLLRRASARVSEPKPGTQTGSALATQALAGALGGDLEGLPMPEDAAGAGGQAAQANALARWLGGSPREAEALASRAIDSARPNALLWVLRSRVRRDLGDASGAAADLRRAREHGGPDLADLLARHLDGLRAR